MSGEKTEDAESLTAEEQPPRPHRPGTFNSETARIAAAARALRARQRKAERELHAQDAQRTTRQRMAASVARLDQKQLDSWIDGLYAAATRNPGSAEATRAGKQLLEVLTQGLGKPQSAPDESPHDNNTPWEQLTPAERAVVFAEYRRVVLGQTVPSDDDSDPRAS